MNKMEYQTDSEFAQLLIEFSGLSPRRHVLEIGSMLGDTLRRWLMTGEPGMTLVSVDKIVPAGDSRHAAQTAAHAEWPSWAAERGAKLTVIDGYSQAPETIAAVRAAVPHLDFLFIDGGHDYATVKADYENYAPLVRPGGLIAFHDIQGIADVARFWQEIKASSSDTKEFCAPGGWGIGVMVKGARPILNVITACSRPKNLPLLADSLIPAAEFFRVHWWIVPDKSVTHLGALAHRQNPGWDVQTLRNIEVRVIDAEGITDYVGGKAQINAALDQIKSGWVWVLDDDNVAHPDFFAELSWVINPSTQAVTFSQASRSGQIRPVGPAWMKECSVDQAQFVLRRDLIGDERYLLRYTADGEFAGRMFQRNPGAWRFCDRALTYYNWLIETP